MRRSSGSRPSLPEHGRLCYHSRHASATQPNIWIYHTITIRRADLTVERGGGYPNERGKRETGLILALAAAPGSALAGRLRRSGLCAGPGRGGRRAG
ncbi:MAG TPA: hypothetical protein VD886_12320 [Herpetosiphonaceae bacterium]|nr:hypothetical protein [Herpetosiphonaceae bacterium]